MTRKERKQFEQRTEEALRGFFGDSYRSAEFCYFRGRGGVLVTYEDFKPEHEIKDEVRQLVNENFNVVLKREYSDLTIMLTMLKLFKENRIAIVDEWNGELRVSQVREYLLRIMERQ